MFDNKAHSPTQLYKFTSPESLENLFLRFHAYPNITFGAIKYDSLSHSLVGIRIVTHLERI